MNGIPDSLSCIPDSKASKFSPIPFGYLVKLSLEKRTIFQLQFVCVVYTSYWVFRNNVSKPTQTTTTTTTTTTITTTSLFQIKYSLQSLCPQLAKAIRGGYKRKRKFYKYINNPRSNLVCCVVYCQSESGRQTVLHTEIHHVTILRIAL